MSETLKKEPKGYESRTELVDLYKEPLNVLSLLIGEKPPKTDEQLARWLTKIALEAESIPETSKELDKYLKELNWLDWTTLLLKSDRVSLKSLAKILSIDLALLTALVSTKAHFSQLEIKYSITFPDDAILPWDRGDWMEKLKYGLEDVGIISIAAVFIYFISLKTNLEIPIKFLSSSIIFLVAVIVFSSINTQEVTYVKTLDLNPYLNAAAGITSLVLAAWLAKVIIHEIKQFRTNTLVAVESHNESINSILKVLQLKKIIHEISSTTKKSIKDDEQKPQIRQLKHGLEIRFMEIENLYPLLTEDEKKWLASFTTIYNQ